MRLYEVIADEYVYEILYEGYIQDLIGKYKDKIKSTGQFFSLVKNVAGKSKIPLATVLSIALSTCFPNYAHSQMYPNQQVRAPTDQEIADFLRRHGGGHQEGPGQCTPEKAGEFSCQQGNRCKCTTYPWGATMLGLPPGASRWECNLEYGQCGQ